MHTWDNERLVAVGMLVYSDHIDSDIGRPVHSLYAYMSRSNIHGHAAAPLAPLDRHAIGDGRGHMLSTTISQ